MPHLYRKDIEHLYNSFVYSPVSLLSSIYPLPAMHSLLVTQLLTIYQSVHITNFTCVIFSLYIILANSFQHPFKGSESGRQNEIQKQECRNCHFALFSLFFITFITIIAIIPNLT